MQENNKNNKKEPTYMAFISYKSADIKYARKLKKFLQSYRLPLKTRKKVGGVSRQCRPIFLDKTNLTPGPLDEGLREEVQDSKFLIIICSRNAHNDSRHLDDELDFFLQGGGDYDHIIPFVVDESKHVVEECFPKRLAELCAENDIVGANIHDDGWRTASIKVVASMLGVKKIELEADDQRRRNIQRITAGVSLLAILITTFMLWSYFKTTIRYYKDYTEEDGIPVGIGELKKKDIVSKYAHYTIVESRNKVRELRIENSYGNLKEPNDLRHLNAAARIKYEYRGDTLSRSIHYNSKDKSLYALNYKDKYLKLPIRKKSAIPLK